MAPHIDTTHSNGNGAPATTQILYRPSQKSRTKDGPKVLPPGRTLENVQAFIDKARQLCGNKNTELIEVDYHLIDGDYMHPCKGHDMHAIVDREYFVASATISPRDVPEVQALMKLCNEYEIPVWPISIGRNTGYGGAAPRVPGSVCLDLGKHMNRILDVDTDGCFALVEPGVTFFDLHEYLEKHGLREKVWLDVSSSIDNEAWKSANYVTGP